MRRLSLMGIVLNAMSCVAIVLFLAYQVVLSVKAKGYVTELDRAGVLSEERLAEYDPTLAHDMRNNLATFITQDYDQALSVVLGIWAVVVVVNFAIFLRCVFVLRSLQSRTP